MSLLFKEFAEIVFNLIDGIKSYVTSGLYSLNSKDTGSVSGQYQGPLAPTTIKVSLSLISSCLVATRLQHEGSSGGTGS